MEKFEIGSRSQDNHEALRSKLTMAYRLWIVFGLMGLTSGHTAAQRNAYAEIGRFPDRTHSRQADSVVRFYESHRNCCQIKLAATGGASETSENDGTRAQSSRDARTQLVSVAKLGNSEL